MISFTELTFQHEIFLLVTFAVYSPVQNESKKPVSELLYILYEMHRGPCARHWLFLKIVCEIGYVHILNVELYGKQA